MNPRAAPRRVLISKEHGTHVDLDKLIHLLVTASTGAGKSSLLRLLLEATHDHMQQLVLDWEGEFSTIGEVADNVVLVGPGGDIPAEPRAAALLGERLLELGFSAIVDLSELKPQQRLEYGRDVLNALVEAPREQWRDVLVVVDEAHNYAPEEVRKGQKPVAKDALVDVASRGRKRGLKLVVATQRLSKLDKDVAAECQDKLVGRLNLNDDRVRAIKELAARSRGRELEHVLATLKPGHFLVMGDALGVDDVVEVHVDRPETKEPPRGAEARTTMEPGPAVRKILEQLQDLPKEAERRRRTVEDLEREVGQLRRDLAAAQRAQPKPEVQVQRVEVPRPFIPEEISHGLRVVHGHVEALLKATAKPIDAPRAPATPVPAPRPPPARVAPVQHDEARGRDGPQQRILDALAELAALGVDPAPLVQVAFLAGYGHTRSKGFTNALGAARSSDLVTKARGDGTVALTPEGAARAHARAQPLTSEELQRRVFELLDGVHVKILAPLISVYPATLPRDELARTAGYEHERSKGFTNPLGRLRSLGFVENADAGEVRASNLLFLEARRGP